jgi:hypothetical protein
VRLDARRLEALAMKPWPASVRYALIGAGAALVAARLVLAPPADGRSFVERVGGPFASFAASVEWVRADVRCGTRATKSATRAAELALELAPSPPDGWIFLARHFLYERASPERESSALARRQWTQASFDILARGEARSSAPQELAFERGLSLCYLAFLAAQPERERPERTRDESSSALFELAAQAFERAAALGHPSAAAMAHSARQRAADEAALGR